MTTPFGPGTRSWADLSGPMAASVLGQRSLAVVPIGAIEHHGPHLPMRTDTLIAESVTVAAVERVAAEGIDAWLLPTISYAKSDEHSGRPGTLWLEGEILLDQLIAIGRSVAATPVRTIVFVNGHGGNVMLLGWANRELRRRFGLRSFSMPAIPPASAGEDMGDEAGQGIHGGYVETSVMMHLAPQLVAAELPPRNIPERIAGLRHIGFNGRPVMFGWMGDDFGPSGVIGDPNGANAADGEILFRRGIDFVSEALAEVDAFVFG